MRTTSQKVLDRQAARDTARRVAQQERLTALVLAAPAAAHDDLVYLAIHCDTRPTFDVILRVLAAR